MCVGDLGLSDGVSCLVVDDESGGELLPSRYKQYSIREEVIGDGNRETTPGTHTHTYTTPCVLRSHYTHIPDLFPSYVYVVIQTGYCKKRIRIPAPHYNYEQREGKDAEKDSCPRGHCPTTNTSS